MNKPYYITTTLPYVNAEPHVGFAWEIVQADALARYQRLRGNEVFFNTGTDEHGQKIYQKAIEAKQQPQAYVDEYAAKFDNLKQALNLSYDNFIRTTADHHKMAAQEIWKRCDKNGYIEKGIYKAKYCVGCELEKTDSELIDGKCPIHPNLEIQIIEEENYFFKFSKFQEKLLQHYDENPKFVVPENRLAEIRNFINQGLQDFSISRLKEKMPWGVAVPGDEKHVMYVWFDALTSYISALEWPENEEKFRKWWPGVQVAGKDNLRQQSAMWQAMLMAAELPPSKQIFIHGFITADGQKMSKSLGNVVNPFELVEKYGTEAVRYYLLAKVPAYDDGDFTLQKFEEAYQADLANGLGNLVARVAAMVESAGMVIEKREEKEFVPKVEEAIENYHFDKAMENVWSLVNQANLEINQKEVWALEGEEKEKALRELVTQVRRIAYNLLPFLPETAEKIQKQFASPSIKRSEALFPRLQ